MTTLNLTYPVPDTVTGVTLSQGVQQVLLTWNMTSNLLDTFEVWRNTTSSSGTATLFATVISNSAVIAGPIPSSTRYYYWVRAVSQTGAAGSFSSSVVLDGIDYTLGSNFNTLALRIRAIYAGGGGDFRASIQNVQYNVNWLTNLNVATSSGWNSFSSTVTQSSQGGTISWTNPDNARVDDTSSATFDATPSSVNSSTALTATNTSGSGGLNWGSINNAKAIDGAYATVVSPGSSASTVTIFPVLKLQGFGFNIPSNATIEGIEIAPTSKYTSGSTGALTWGTVQAVHPTSGNGTNLANPLVTTIFTTDGSSVFGSASEKWGLTWTPADVNNPSFGINCRMVGTTATTDRTGQLESVTVTVFYVIPPERSYYLDFNMNDVGVPATATVTGIQVKVNASVYSATTTTLEPSLHVAGDTVVLGTNTSFAFGVDNTFETHTVGAVDNIWSLPNVNRDSTFILPAQSGNSGKVLTTNGTYISWETPPSGSGEVNTASSVGTSGIAVYKQKTGVNLEFRSIAAAASNKIAVGLNSTNNSVDIDIIESNLTLANLSGNLSQSRIVLGSPLSDIVAISTTGFVTRVASNVWSAVTFSGASSKIAVVNGDGSGNVTIDVTEGNLTLNNIGGTLGITKGGTGQITANASLNALLPAQTTANGKVLQSNGTDAAWVTPAVGSVIASGLAEVDFGAVTTGALYSNVVVTGITGILTGSKIKVWVNPIATTDHTAMDVVVDPPRVTASDIVAGTGFTVHAFSYNNVEHYGKYSVAYEIT